MPIVTGRSGRRHDSRHRGRQLTAAAQAGAQMLARGGHAVDAAIAANAVLGVVEPYMNGMGGDLFAMVYDAGRDALHGLNASGRRPRRSPDAAPARGLTAMPAAGIHSVTVPGAVADGRRCTGASAAAARRRAAPAAFYAEDGFPVAPVVAEGGARLEERWRAIRVRRRRTFQRCWPQRGDALSKSRPGALAAARRRARPRRVLSRSDRGRDRVALAGPGRHADGRRPGVVRT
jgi:gamma-glutamyltranspeptidase